MQNLIPTIVKVQRRKGKVIQSCDVYISRDCFVYGWKWQHDPVWYPGKSTVTDLEKYREYAEKSEDLQLRIPELVGQRLGCWCSDTSKCHGVVLQQLVQDYLKSVKECDLQSPKVILAIEPIFPTIVEKKSIIVKPVGIGKIPHIPRDYKGPRVPIQIIPPKRVEKKPWTRPQFNREWWTVYVKGGGGSRSEHRVCRTPRDECLVIPKMKKGMLYALSRNGNRKKMKSPITGEMERTLDWSPFVCKVLARSRKKKRNGPYRYSMKVTDTGKSQEGYKVFLSSQLIPLIMEQFIKVGDLIYVKHYSATKMARRGQLIVLYDIRKIIQS